VPQPRGLDKWTNLDDRKDEDLFDFNLEAEPILQVLVGKALELARIEVIEVFEK
jgi:Radial spoke protein 3